MSGLTERVVEVPWALARYNGGARVLEVGCSFAYENPSYITGLQALGISELHGIDISSVPAPDFIKKTGDIRSSGYPDDFFDMIFCISTLEHVGRDNARHYSPVAEIQTTTPGQDEAALREMVRITRPGGKLIITVPFGRWEDHGWFVNYDAANIARVFRNMPPHEAEYFRFAADAWVRCRAEDLADVGYQKSGAPAAAGLACFEIEKR